MWAFVSSHLSPFYTYSSLGKADVWGYSRNSYLLDNISFCRLPKYTYHSFTALLLLCFSRHHINMWKSHISFPFGVSIFVVVPLYQAVRSRTAETLRALLDNTGCLSHSSQKQTAELRHLQGTICGTGERKQRKERIYSLQALLYKMKRNGALLMKQVLEVLYSDHIHGPAQLTMTHK